MQIQCFVSCPLLGFSLHWLHHPGLESPSVKEIQLTTDSTVVILVFDILELMFIYLLLFFFTILTFLSVQFNSVKYIRFVGPPSIPVTLFIL